MILIICPILGYFGALIFFSYVDDWKFQISNLFFSSLGVLAGLAFAVLCCIPTAYCAETVVESTEEMPIYVMYQIKDAENNVLGDIYLEEEDGDNYKYVTYKENVGYQIALSKGGDCFIERTSEAPYVTIYTRNFKSKFLKWFMGNNYTYEYIFHLPSPSTNISQPTL